MKAVVVRIDEPVSINDKFRKREIIVKTTEAYPQHIILQVVNDKCEILNNFQVDQEVDIEYNLRGRMLPDGRCFNTLEIWKIN